jgi:hypothetical protein
MCIIQAGVRTSMSAGCGAWAKGGASRRTDHIDDQRRLIVRALVSEAIVTSVVGALALGLEEA